MTNYLKITIITVLSRACREFQKDYSGIPIKQIQQQQVVFIMNSKRDNETQDAEVVAGDQKSLPEEEKE